MVLNANEFLEGRVARLGVVDQVGHTKRVPCRFEECLSNYRLGAGFRSSPRKLLPLDWLISHCRKLTCRYSAIRYLYCPLNPLGGKDVGPMAANVMMSRCGVDYMSQVI